MKTFQFKQNYVVLNSNRKFKKVTYIGTIPNLNGHEKSFYFSSNQNFIDTLKTEEDLLLVSLNSPQNDILVAKSPEGIIPFINDTQIELLENRFNRFIDKASILSIIWSIRTFFPPQDKNWENSRLYFSLTRNKKLMIARLIIFLTNSLFMTLLKPFILLTVFITRLFWTPFSKLNNYLGAQIYYENLIKRKNKTYIFNSKDIDEQIENAKLIYNQTQNEFADIGTSFLSLLISIIALIISILPLILNKTN